MTLPQQASRVSSAAEPHASHSETVNPLDTLELPSAGDPLSAAKLELTVAPLLPHLNTRDERASQEPDALAPSASPSDTPDSSDNFGLPSADDPWRAAELELIVTLRLGEAASDQQRRALLRRVVCDEERLMAGALLAELRRIRKERQIARLQA